MKYDLIITSTDQLPKVNELMKATEKRANQNEINKYAFSRLAIVGVDVIKAFEKSFVTREYYGKLEDVETPKTDNKTRAQILPYMKIEYHFDARDGHNALCDKYYSSLVMFDGTMYDTLKSWTGKGFRFVLMGDTTDYNKYLPSQWEKDNEEPNNVGTITDKKMQDWANYLQSKFAAAMTEKGRINDKISLFKARFNALDPNDFDEYKCHQDGRGYIEKNGLRYSFCITSSGYIEQSIEVIRYLKDNRDTLAQFLDMAKGKYNKK